MDGLKGLGGVSGLAKALCSDTHTGLDPTAEGPTSVAGHGEVFGANRFKETPPKAFLTLMWENLQDPIIILLCFAALVSNGTMAPSKGPPRAPGAAPRRY